MPLFEKPYYEKVFLALKEDGVTCCQGANFILSNISVSLLKVYNYWLHWIMNNNYLDYHMQVTAFGLILNVWPIVLQVSRKYFQLLITHSLIFPAIPVDRLVTSWHQRIRPYVNMCTHNSLSIKSLFFRIHSLEDHVAYWQQSKWRNGIWSIIILKFTVHHLYCHSLPGKLWTFN